jgi:hypothetical protein
VPVTSPELPSPSPPDDAGRACKPAPAFTQNLPGGSATWLAALGLGATLVARGLAPALPGSRSGIAVWIALSDQLGAFLSQLLAFYGLLLGTWLVLATARARHLPGWYRTASTPVAAAVIVFTALATGNPLRPWWTVWLGVGTALLAVAAAARALGRSETRAAGFVLGAMALGALLDIAGRLVALRASEQALSALFNLGRAIATASFTCKVTSLLLVALWLTARRWRTTALVLVIVLGGLVAVSLGVSHASEADASWWTVLASRALAGLMRHPAPLVAPAFRSMVELSLVIGAVAVLLARRPPRPLLAIVALALASRGSTDIPLCAMLLTVAALMAALVTSELMQPAQERAPEP